MASKLELDRQTDARLRITRLLNTTLYQNETPDFYVEVIGAGDHDGSYFVLLTTNLPDDMLYVVTWTSDLLEPIIRAFKKVDLS